MRINSVFHVLTIIYLLLLTPVYLPHRIKVRQNETVQHHAWYLVSAQYMLVFPPCIKVFLSPKLSQPFS